MLAMLVLRTRGGWGGWVKENVFFYHGGGKGSQAWWRKMEVLCSDATHRCAEREEACLIWLDATTMSELGRAYTGSPAPISFHGQWIPCMSS